MKHILNGLAPDRVRNYVRRGILNYRRATWSKRRLPDFIIVGAQKSGTSSLHAYLSQHPQIVPAIKKEVHFFCGGLDPEIDSYSRGEAWYRAHFPLHGMLGSKQRTFEATPLYLYNPLAAKRMAKLVPKVKLVAILRNPTERAISHYFHSRRHGYEELEIDDALRREEERLRPLIEAQEFKSVIFRTNSYKTRGLYKQQLSRYLEYFDRGQLLVLSSDQLFHDPNRTLKRVFGFVGVSTNFQVPNLTPRNSGTNRSTVCPEVYEYLNSYFESPNTELYEMLGEDYGW